MNDEMKAKRHEELMRVLNPIILADVGSGKVERVAAAAASVCDDYAARVRSESKKAEEAKPESKPEAKKAETAANDKKPEKKEEKGPANNKKK